MKLVLYLFCSICVIVTFLMAVGGSISSEVAYLIGVVQGAACARLIRRLG